MYLPLLFSTGKKLTQQRTIFLAKLKMRQQRFTTNNNKNSLIFCRLYTFNMNPLSLFFLSSMSPPSHTSPSWFSYLLLLIHISIPSTSLLSMLSSSCHSHAPPLSPSHPPGSLLLHVLLPSPPPGGRRSLIRSLPRSHPAATSSSFLQTATCFLPVNSHNMKLYIIMFLAHLTQPKL